MRVTAVSIVICTFNRAARLRETLAALEMLRPPEDCAVEVVIVDNNSTDETQAVIADAGRTAPYPFVLLQETRQGKSFALNTALAAARGDVLALIDDDVLPSPDWLTRIVDRFRERDVTFVFGKVLPRWECDPPPELLTRRAHDIWGPLALVDYGDEAMDYTPASHSQRLPIGANLSFSRQAILRIGGWRTDLGKVNNTLISGEDHEIFMRLRRFGLYAGYYDPGLTVRHFVPAQRLTRAYFRRWFFWHGLTQALMLDDLFPELQMSTVPRLAGAPRFAYRQALETACEWFRSRLSGDRFAAFIDELRLVRYAGLFAGCYRSSAVGNRPVQLASTARSAYSGLMSRILRSR